MNEVDDATLAKWKSDAAEKMELLIRKKWLLQKHPDFNKELKEIALAAGKSLKCKWSFVDNGINRTMIWDFLHWDNLKELDKHGTPRHSFMVQYDLIPEPPGAGALTWELAKLRALKKAASWGDRKTFWRDTEWYELRQQVKSDREVVEIILTKKGDWIRIDLRALDYWQEEEPSRFKNLCRIAKVSSVPDKIGKLKLLYHLGRFTLGRAKGNRGWPDREYPPFDGGSKELQTERLYLVHVNYEWPEEPERGINQLFSREPELPTSSELEILRNGSGGFDEAWHAYTDEEYIYPMRRMINKQIQRMKKKINKTYEFYQKQNMT